MNPTPSLRAGLTRIEALESRLAPAGLVILALQGSVMNITGDAGNNVFTITEIPGGSWFVQDLSGGGTQFQLQGVPGQTATAVVDSTLTLKINGLGGDDTIILTGINLGGTLSILGGEGADGIQIIKSSVNGIATLDTGNGTGGVSITGDSTFNNTLNIKMLGGTDTVLLGGSDFRTVNVDMGTGANNFNMNGLVTVFGSLSVTSSDANALAVYNLQANELQVTGAVTLKSTKAAMAVNVGADFASKTSIGGAFVVTGAAGNDNITLTGACSILGAMTLNLGAGNNTLGQAALMKIAAGSLVYTGTTGNDTIFLQGSDIKIGGAATFNMGSGTNFAVLAPSGALKIGGALSYVGDTGTDLLTLGSPGFVATQQLFISGALSFKGGNGSNGMYIDTVVGQVGSFAYTGGTGSDEVVLGDTLTNLTTRLTINGAVTATLGAGDSTFNATDVYFQSTLTVTSATLLAAGGAPLEIENIILNEVTVTGATTLSATGTARSTFQLEDATTVGVLTINSGAGDDTVALDTLAGTAATSTFLRAVKINLGAGNDNFQAGNNTLPPFAGVNFNVAPLLVVDGGLGNDTANFINGFGNNFFGIPVTPANRPNVEIFN